MVREGACSKFIYSSFHGSRRVGMSVCGDGAEEVARRRRISPPDANTGNGSDTRRERNNRGTVPGFRGETRTILIPPGPGSVTRGDSLLEKAPARSHDRGGSPRATRTRATARLRQFSVLRLAEVDVALGEGDLHTFLSEAPVDFQVELVDNPAPVHGVVDPAEELEAQ